MKSRCGGFKGGRSSRCLCRPEARSSQFQGRERERARDSENKKYGEDTKGSLTLLEKLAPTRSAPISRQVWPLSPRSRVSFKRLAPPFPPNSSPFITIQSWAPAPYSNALIKERRVLQLNEYSFGILMKHIFHRMILTRAK